MSSIRTCALLALLSAFSYAADVSAAYSFFPAAPAFGDQLYLLHPSDCSDQEVPVTPPTMTRHVGMDGALVWTLQYAVRPSECPEPSYATVYAFPLPDEIFTVASDTVWLRIIDADSGQQISQTLLPQLLRVGLPPSIAGTWVSPLHADQGLMVGYDDLHRIVVSWHTFGATGAPRWMTGIAQAPWDTSRVTVPLVTALSGVFAGGNTSAPDVDAWGDVELDYTGCGEMTLRWAPYPTTGLAPGSARFHQLTGNVDAHCNLPLWAERRGMVVEERVPELIDEEA